MTQPDLSALTRGFTPDELHTFQGRGGKPLTYIEDETVMDRLDEAFGIGGWAIFVEPVDQRVVKVRLSVKFDETWVVYEDFGYPNNDAGEALKEAVSDGIRRCGRYLGIARDIYRKPDSSNSHSTAARPSPPAGAAGRAAPPPRPAAPVTPPEPDWMDEGAEDAASGHVRNGDHQPLTFAQLADELRLINVSMTSAGQVAKQMFGGKGMLKELTNEQRGDLLAELR